MVAAIEEGSVSPERRRGALEDQIDAVLAVTKRWRKFSVLDDLRPPSLRVRSFLAAKDLANLGLSAVSLRHLDAARGAEEAARQRAASPVLSALERLVELAEAHNAAPEDVEVPLFWALHACAAIGSPSHVERALSLVDAATRVRPSGLAMEELAVALADGAGPKSAKRAGTLLCSLVSAGHPPRTATCNAVLASLLRSRAEDSAACLLEAMEASGVARDALTASLAPSQGRTGRADKPGPATCSVPQDSGARRGSGDPPAATTTASSTDRTPAPEAASSSKQTPKRSRRRRKSRGRRARADSFGSSVSATSTGQPAGGPEATESHAPTSARPGAKEQSASTEAGDTADDKGGRQEKRAVAPDPAESPSAADRGRRVLQTLRGDASGEGLSDGTQPVASDSDGAIVGTQTAASAAGEEEGASADSGDFSSGADSTQQLDTPPRARSTSVASTASDMSTSLFVHDTSHKNPLGGESPSMDTAAAAARRAARVVGKGPRERPLGGGARRDGDRSPPPALGEAGHGPASGGGGVGAALGREDGGGDQAEGKGDEDDEDDEDEVCSWAPSGRRRHSSPHLGPRLALLDDSLLYTPPPVAPEDLPAQESSGAPLAPGQRQEAAPALSPSPAFSSISGSDTERWAAGHSGFSRTGAAQRAGDDAGAPGVVHGPPTGDATRTIPSTASATSSTASAGGAQVTPPQCAPAGGDQGPGALVATRNSVSPPMEAGRAAPSGGAAAAAGNGRPAGSRAQTEPPRPFPAGVGAPVAQGRYRPAESPPLPAPHPLAAMGGMVSGRPGGATPPGIAPAHARAQYRGAGMVAPLVPAQPRMPGVGGAHLASVPMPPPAAPGPGVAMVSPVPGAPQPRTPPPASYAQNAASPPPTTPGTGRSTGSVRSRGSGRGERARRGKYEKRWQPRARPHATPAAAAAAQARERRFSGARLGQAAAAAAEASAGRERRPSGAEQLRGAERQRPASSAASPHSKSPASHSSGSRGAPGTGTGTGAGSEAPRASPAAGTGVPPLQPQQPAASDAARADAGAGTDTIGSLSLETMSPASREQHLGGMMRVLGSTLWNVDDDGRKRGAQSAASQGLGAPALSAGAPSQGSDGFADALLSLMPTNGSVRSASPSSSASASASHIHAPGDDIRHGSVDGGSDCMEGSVDESPADLRGPIGSLATGETTLFSNFSQHSGSIPGARTRRHSDSGLNPRVTAAAASGFARAPETGSDADAGAGVSPVPNEAGPASPAEPGQRDRRHRRDPSIQIDSDFVEKLDLSFMDEM